MVVTEAPTTQEDTVEQRTYTVTGMTCGHCVASVTEEVGEIAGVSSVDVVLESGVVTVTGEGVADEAVKAAVEEAGYAVAP
jgi:copper chaperone